MTRITIIALLLTRFLQAQSPANYTTPPEVKMTAYVVGIIRKGPNSGTGTEAERQRIQEGHMANIRKMAGAGKLIVAGPVQDSDLRGLFIFCISSTEEARALVNEDPAVVSGRLVVDYYQWYAPVGLRVDIPASARVDPSREQVVQIAHQIQRADYEGDRASLKRLYGELTPFIENRELAFRVRYWRGFALWRRAINGFNDSIDPKELKEDLNQAVNEFDVAAKQDESFADAKIGALSCVTLLAFSVYEKDPARMQELVAHGRQLKKDIEAAAPENPRFFWVLGPNLWFTPPERGGGQGKAMDVYERGLDAIRKHKTDSTDPLEPSWGEPELLMNLAWSNLNRTTPDLDAAESYGRKTLELVPYWHFVRDILMPQIRNATAQRDSTRR